MYYFVLIVMFPTTGQDGLKVVAMATGSKCIGQSKLSKEGNENIRHFQELVFGDMCEFSQCKFANWKLHSV